MSFFSTFLKFISAVDASTISNKILSIIIVEMYFAFLFILMLHSRCFEQLAWVHGQIADDPILSDQFDLLRGETFRLFACSTEFTMGSTLRNYSADEFL